MRQRSGGPSWSDRFRYAFDALMARGAWALVGWHLVLALAAVVVVSILVAALGLTPIDPDSNEPIGFAALVWTTLMHAIDPGTITGDEDAGPFRALMMLATVLGILLVGSLVAVLVASVSERFDELRQGRSRVLESDHTLVVGWSRQLFTLCEELAQANHSRGGGVIVIYAEHDKVWMEDELRSKVGKLRKTKIVVRSGDPSDPDALAVVAPEHARAIVVLAPEEAQDDTEVVRALLAVGRSSAAPGRTQHVVTELRDPRNLAVARLTSSRRTEVLEIGDLVAKIAVQTCLQAGLSVVYEELLSFSGDEIYFVDADPVVGRSFGAAMQEFEACTLLGLREREGAVVLNPGMDRVIAAGEQIIVIAADDDQICAAPWTGELDQAAMAASPSSSPRPVRTLILGWNARVPAIVAGIDAYVAPGSEVEVVSADPGAAAILDALGPNLTRVALSHRFGDVSDRRVLDALAPRTWNHVMLLPADRIASATQADAQVLVALLHLRDLAEELERPFSVVSEVRDVRSRDLAEVARADDFIISDRFIGLLLAQIAENADLAGVFAELFDPQGSEIYLRPASDYLVGEAEVELRTLVEVGRRRGEIVIGVRVMALSKDPGQNFGIRINPPKSTRLRLRASDRVIVLAP